MHKHMRKQLPRLKKRRKNMVKRKSVGNPSYFGCKVSALTDAIERQLCQKDQHIDNEQIFDYNREYLKPSGAKFCHVCFIEPAVGGNCRQAKIGKANKLLVKAAIKSKKLAPPAKKQERLLTFFSCCF